MSCGFYNFGFGFAAFGADSCFRAINGTSGINRLPIAKAVRGGNYVVVIRIIALCALYKIISVFRAVRGHGFSHLKAMLGGLAHFNLTALGAVSNAYTYVFIVAVFPIAIFVLALKAECF